MPIATLLKKTIFDQYRVEPYFASITRNSQCEQVVVVAQKGGEVIYWEDVEEGFNISPISSNQQILKPGFEQDELHLALNRWR